MNPADEMMREAIISAASNMINRGAPTKDDGFGFNKVSFSAVMGILNKDYITLSDYERLAHHLIRHRGQAASYINIEELKAWKEKAAAFPYEFAVDIENGVVRITMPYNKDHGQIIAKKVLGTRWEAPFRVIPLGSIMEFAKAFNEVIPGMTDALRDALKGAGINAKWIKENHADAVKAAAIYAENAVATAKEKNHAYFSFRDEMIYVAFDYSSEIIAAIKSLPNHARAFVDKNTGWSVSPDHFDMLVEALGKVGAIVDGDFNRVEEICHLNYKAQANRVSMADVQSKINTDEAMEIVRRDWSEINGKKLYPHQISGISFMLTVGNCINADQTGLGKTLEAIVAMQIQRSNYRNEWGMAPALCITPASLKINWMREILGTLKKGVVVIATTQRNFVYVGVDNYNGFQQVRMRKNQPRPRIPYKGLAGLTRVDYLIVNYDIAGTLREDINAWKRETGCKIICADEAHFMKNYDSNRTKAINGWTQTKSEKVIEKTPKGEREAVKQTKIVHEGIAEGMEVRYALTGTPVTGKNRDLLPLLTFIAHPLARKPRVFLNKYCAPESSAWGVTYDGNSNSEELYAECATNMIQRRKQDVLEGFPLKQRVYEYVEVDTDAYWDYWNRYVETYEEVKGKQFNHNVEELTQLSVLRRYASTLKIPAIKEYAHKLLDEGRKVILFTGFTETAEEMMKEFADYGAVQIVGGMSGTKKDAAVQSFQNDDNCKVIVCNYLAAGVGLTLTKSSIVLMCDLTWLPSDHFQAEDRAWRIGQTNDVTIVYFVAVDTHEEDVQRAVDERGKIIDIMENANYVAANEWQEIFTAFTARAKARAEFEAAV